jgi:hypothetical protein
MFGSHGMLFYWGDRKESMTACSDRLIAFLLTLKALNGHVFESWRLVEDPPKKSFDVPPTPAQLERILRDGGSKEKLDRSLGLGLGCQMTLVTNKDDYRVTIHIHCGGRAVNGLENTCFVFFDESNQSVELFWKYSKVIEFSRAIVDSWDPDFGFAAPMNFPEAFDSMPSHCRVGWVTYLSKKQAGIGVVPTPGRVVKYGSGEFIIATEETFAYKNPQHADFVTKVSYMLLAKEAKKGMP